MHLLNVNHIMSKAERERRQHQRDRHARSVALKRERDPRRYTPNDPFPYMARASRLPYLTHYVGPDGRRDLRLLPWVMEYWAEVREIAGPASRSPYRLEEARAAALR